MKLANIEPQFLIDAEDWFGLANAIAQHNGLSSRIELKVEVRYSHILEELSLRIRDKIYYWSMATGFYSYESSHRTYDDLARLTVTIKRI